MAAVGLRWWFARLVLLVLTAFGLLWPLLAGLQVSSSGAAEDPVVISDYQASFDVASNGTLTAVEDITARFPSDRHGIFRYWDLSDSADPGVRYQPHITSITQDGRPATVQTSWESGRRFLVAKIGDADRYLEPGLHHYQIAYTIDGAISPAAAGAAEDFASSTGTDASPARSAFLWTVVARGWEMRIEKATAVVSLPSASQVVECSAGTDAGIGPCTIEGAGSQQVTVAAADLPPRSGMVVRATMATPVPDRAHLPWPIAWDPIVGHSVPAVVVVLVLSALGLVAGFAWARTAHEEPPGFPVQYAPPDGLGPVQTVYLHTEGVGPAPLVATLMNLAERGLVRLDRDSADVWSVTNLAPATAWESVDPVARGVVERLDISTTGSFQASKTATAGKALQSATRAIGGDVQRWATQTGLVRTAAGELWGRAAWIISALLAVLGFSGLAWPTMVGLPFAAFAIGAVPLWATGVGHRRTLPGRAVWSRAGGFERLLSTPSAGDRFDFAARKDLFLAFVPYAVAFGVADRWAQKYRTAVGAEPPVPGWYPWYGTGASSFYSSGTGPDSFSSAVTASIAAYTATQTPSGGGGGFSGGGGGGGGGGSW